MELLRIDFIAFCRIHYTEMCSTIPHTMTNEQEAAMFYQTLPNENTHMKWSSGLLPNESGIK